MFDWKLPCCVILVIICFTLSGCVSGKYHKNEPDADLAKRGFGYYEGDLLIRVLEEDRRVQLIKDYTYVDSRRHRWTTPTDWIVDGASIPRLFWTAVGSPFVGRHRFPSVIHDYLCDTKEITWQKTHHIFYEACLAAGTQPTKAKLMYLAILMGGPQWTDPSFEAVTQQAWVLDFTPSQYDEMANNIRQHNPSIEEIDRQMMTFEEKRRYFDPSGHFPYHVPPVE